MDENRTVTGEPRRRRRASLVEKAAAKLAGRPITEPGAGPAADAAEQGASIPAAFSGAEAPPKRTSRRVSIDFERMRAAGIVTNHSEGSLLAEEFRLVKRPLLLKAFDKGPNAIRNGNLIMVASGGTGEGKTFCAVSLAMSMASERDLTVMLIDADLGRPSIPSVLGFDADLGLADLIADDELDMADVLVRTDLDNLTVLPAGRHNHLATELLASGRMEHLIDEIGRRYADRVIIIDSPPVLMSSIASVLALYVGQTVFVVQAEQSTQASIDAALGLVSACNNIYLLLNKARKIGEADRFGAYYGYNRS